MPQLIDYIDQIARKKKRGVLFIEFHWLDSDENNLVFNDHYDYESDKTRRRVINWLDSMKIKWLPCAEYGNEDAMVPYMGQIYIDLPFDESNVKYRCLDRYMHKRDGSPRFQTVRFCFLSLKLAMKNAYQDAPGFWEKWAANF